MIFGAHTADGRRLAMRKGTTLSYFANDHLGGTSVVMNDAGGVVSRVRYYPYGNIWTQETGAPPTDKLFTGQRRYGPKSGIYHYGARFYSADIGRFLSPDSIVPGAGNPQALNRYSYVLNNPLRYADPTGHCIPDINCAGQDDNENTDQLDSQPSGGVGGGGVDFSTPQKIYDYLVDVPGVSQQEAACTAFGAWICDWVNFDGYCTSFTRCSLAMRNQVAVYLMDHGNEYHEAMCTAFGALSNSCDILAAGGECAYYGRTCGGKWGGLKQLGEVVGGILNAVTSECAAGLAGVGITIASVVAAAGGAWALYAAGGVMVTASAAATSAAGLYYAAGPENVQNIIEYGPSSAVTVYEECW